MNTTLDTHEPIRIVSLSPADAEAVDALLDPAAQYTTVHVTPDRLQRVEQVLNVLRQYPADGPSADLARRTLAQIESARQRQQLAQRAAALGGAPIAFRWPELIAVAAVMMIAVSLMWPMLDQMRNDARRVACSTQLSGAGSAIASYAADHAGLLPRGKVEPNSTWWHVGEQTAPDAPVRSNSAHLYRLITYQYVHPATLACPENPTADRTTQPGQTDWRAANETSYSYQNQYRPEPLRIDAVPNLAVLADKNPLFAGPQYQRDLLPTSPSELHQRVGQNVLSIDGHVRWTSDPVVNGDNIWLGEDVDPDMLRGTEVPAEEGDSFLVP